MKGMQLGWQSLNLSCFELVAEIGLEFDCSGLAFLLVHWYVYIEAFSAG